MDPISTSQSEGQSHGQGQVQRFKNESEFRNPVLSALHHGITHYLFTPFWESLDGLLAIFLTTAGDPKRSFLGTAFTFTYHVVFVILTIPMAILAAPIWLMLLPFQSRYYKTVVDQRQLDINKKTRFNENGQTLSVLTANVCLLTEIACRVNRLSDNKRRAEKIAKRLLDCPEKFRSQPVLLEAINLGHHQGDEDSESNQNPNHLLNLSHEQAKKATFLTTHVSEQTDVVCLQECFNRSCAQKIVNQLSKSYPYIIWDMGAYLSPRLGSDRQFFSAENSGLLLASKYPIVKKKFKIFNNACCGDRFASKGVLLAILQVTENDYALVVNTHLQAQDGPRPSEIRVSQLKFIHSEMNKLKNEFLHERNYSESCVKFEILMGDLNFDLYSDKLENSVFYKPGYFNRFLDAHLSGEAVPTALFQENIYECGDSAKLLEQLKRASKNITNAKKILPHLHIEPERRTITQNICRSNREKRVSREDSEASTNSRSSCIVTINSQNHVMTESAKSGESHDSGRGASMDSQEAVSLKKMMVDDNLDDTKMRHKSAAVSAMTDGSNPFDHEGENQAQIFELHPKTGFPLKLDHIWFDPKFCEKVCSEYVTAFYDLTDHVPLAAKFKIRQG